MRVELDCVQRESVKFITHLMESSALKRLEKLWSRTLPLNTSTTVKYKIIIFPKSKRECKNNSMIYKHTDGK